jgi:hypothetical protein
MAGGSVVISAVGADAMPGFDAPSSPPPDSPTLTDAERWPELFPPESPHAPKRVVLQLAGSRPIDENKDWVDTHTGRLIVAITTGLVVAVLYLALR